MKNKDLYLFFSGESLMKLAKTHVMKPVITKLQNLPISKTLIKYHINKITDQYLKFFAFNSEMLEEASWCFVRNHNVSF